MKKFVSVILSFLLLVNTLISSTVFASAASYEEQLKKEGFPDSYIQKLSSLHKSHPKWKFVPYNTGVSFASAIKGERSSHKKQILEKGYDNKYYCSCSNCKKGGKFVYQYSGCYSASEWAVKYYMDPRNWMDEKHIFQFESNKYNSAHTQSGVESIISKTWMKDSYITYINTSGNNATFKNSDGNKVKYSKAIMSAAKNNNISAYYIASRIVKEVGATKPTASGTKGNKTPFIGMYNYYSIGATSGGMSGVEWASGFLKTEKKTTLYSTYDKKTKKPGGTKTSLSNSQRMSYIGTYGNYYKVKLYSGENGSYSTNGKIGYVLKADLRTKYFNYGRPWTNPNRAINGGAAYISDKYLTYQYTTYLEKFNVSKKSGSLYNHEYMQNVDAPSHEAVSKYNAYKNAGQLNTEKTFYIPVFTDMPGAAKESTTTAETTKAAEKVTGLKVVDTTTTSISLKWNKFNNAEKYYIWVKNISKGTTFSKTVKTPSATLNNLTRGKVYEIRVKAYTGKWSAYSGTVKARCVPKRSVITKMSSPAKGNLKTVWQYQSGADGYQVVYAKDKKFKNVVAKRFSTKANRVGKNFTSGKTYYVKVRPYIVIKDKKYFGKFSKIKSIKIK